jgi:ATP-binding cassette subfamily B protein
MIQGAAGKMHRRSSRAGNECWRVDVLFGNRPLAEALRKDLEARAGIKRVRVNPWLGRVTLDFAPESIVSPVEDLLRQAVERCLLSDAEQALPEWAGLLRLLGCAFDGGDRLAGPVALSLASHLVHILQGLSLISTVDEARNAAVKGLGKSSLRTKSTITLMLSSADALLRHHKRTSWQRLARDFESDLRAKVFGAVVAQDLAARDKIGTGRLLNAVTSDVGQLGALVDRGIDDALLNLLQAIVAVGLLLGRAPGLALVAAVPLGLFALPSRKLAKQSAEARTEQAALSDALTQILENSLAGLAEIKSYTAEEAVLNRVANSARKLAETAKEAGRIYSSEAHLFEGVFGIGFAMMATIGGSRLAKGKISQAAYTKALYSFPQLLASFAGLQVAVAQVRDAAAAATRLVQILDTESAIADGTVSLPATEVRGEVSFEDVSFGYENGRPVVEQVGFHVPSGGMLGVVGPTGSGKSTLVRLLLRFYDVVSGRILLDGHDIRTLRMADLRSAIAVVGQEPYLFRGSVRNNVAFGRPSATDDEIREALRRAEALEFVEQHPGGLAAEIGERGQRLSGGQRQRLAIARALLKPAPVLVLDEATSQVDYETEAAIQRAVRDASAGRTLIVVAHRLSTIRGADQILVFDQGRIRERGRHEELLELGGLYALLWSLQDGGGGRSAGGSG